MPKQIIIAEQHRIAAVFAEDQIQELVVATGSHQVGDIYLGIVENVLPGIDAAFVNIGDADRNGFIHVTDLGPLRLKRSAGAITELLTPQQKVLVQVMKEPTGTKGPRLTGNITLPGRYLVLMPYGRGVNLSRRIRSENERNRLRALAILIKPAGMGLLVRTEAENMPEEAIMEDLEALQRQWEAIQQEAVSTRAPALLNRDDDFIQRVLRDMFSGDVNRIVVDSHTGVKRVRQQLTLWNGGRVPPGVLIDHHRDRIPVLEYFRVNAAIREALKPRVDLPSGGYIIIEPTEALTVIDVNSGSFTRSATARETVLWTNCEAATEIARQLRLRNIAGVIVVDFIDMDSHKDQLQVLEHFNKALRADKARPQIAQLSELGLVELTRKRQGQNIYELFGQACPTCNGLGHLAHFPGEGETGPQPLIERSSASLRQETSTPRFAEPVYNRAEPRSAPALPETPASWQSEAYEPDTAGDGLEISLTNHPSYQEQGGIDRKRTRRRRRDDEISSLGMRSNGDLMPSDSYSLKPEQPMMGSGRSWDEKPGRDRERPRTLKKHGNKIPVTPPEVVSVTMTPEEQDIYALMGVSPLVLAERQVKNPKSAIVEINLPGEAPRYRALTPTPDDYPDDGEEADFSESSADEFMDSIPNEMEELDQEPMTLFFAEPEPEPEPEPVTSEAEGVENSAETSAEETRRRRRRRSSALE